MLKIRARDSRNTELDITNWFARMDYSYDALWALYQQEGDISSHRRVGCSCSTEMYCDIALSWFHYADEAMVTFTGRHGWNGTFFEEFDAARQLYRKRVGNPDGYA